MIQIHRKMLGDALRIYYKINFVQSVGGIAGVHLM